MPVGGTTSSRPRAGRMGDEGKAVGSVTWPTALLFEPNSSARTSNAKGTSIPHNRLLLNLGAWGRQRRHRQGGRQRARRDGERHSLAQAGRVVTPEMHGSQSTPALGWESKTLQLSIPLRTTAAESGRAGNLAAAVLFGLPLYRRCLRIFDFHPMR
jgi:hypothetical protein